ERASFIDSIKLRLTMLNWKLEAEAESTMAFELLKFIKSQLEVEE
ncbi:hypothetical protein Tco_0673205, partial [Tanacetum coccineum]